MSESTFEKSDIELNFSIIDSVQINSESVQVYVDSSKTKDYLFSEISGELNLSLQNVSSGEHVIRIVAANKNGNHAFPFHLKIMVKELTEN